MPRGFALVTASLSLTSVSVLSAQSNLPPVFAAQQVLLQRTTSVHDLGTVSPDTQQAIVRFKDALAEASDRALRSLPPAATAEQARTALAQSLPAESVGSAEFKAAAAITEKPSTAPAQVAGLYGSGLRVRVTQPRPDLLLVEEGFVLPCGDDVVLLGYRLSGDAWSRVLRWQSKPYSTMDGAFGDSFAALPLYVESNGLPLLVVKHGRPWCTSTASRLSLTVLQISAAEPKVLWSTEQDYRRFDLDYMSKLTTTPEGFGVRASFPSLDETQLGKEMTRVYRVTPQAVVRALPLAARSVDVVDEWFQMPWSEAKGYVDSADRRDLQGIHWRVHKDSGSHQHLGPVEYLSQRSCNDSPSRQQVELDLRPADTKVSETAVVLVEPASDKPIRFASAVLDPACDGRDQLHADESHPVASK